MKIRFLLLSMFCLLAAFGAKAQDDSGSAGDKLTWTYDNGTLTISGTGAMDDYATSNDIPWYHRRTDITSVIIEEGVTTIGKSALFYLEGITSIILPSTLTQIGEGGLNSCVYLEKITALSDTKITLAAASSLSAVGAESRKCDVIVPTSVLSAYQNDPLWAGDNALGWGKATIKGGGCLVVAKANNDSYGTVSGTGLYDDTTASLTATPEDGFSFTNWTINGGGSSTANPYSFVPDRNVVVTANFSSDSDEEPSITITSPSNNATVNTNEVELTFTVSNFVIGTDGSVVYRIGPGEIYAGVTPQSSGDNYTVTIPGLTEGSNLIKLGLLADGDEMPGTITTITIVYSTGSEEPAEPQNILLVRDNNHNDFYDDIVTHFKNLFEDNDNQITICNADDESFPDDLSIYTQIWDIRHTVALSEDIQTAYLTFLQSGKQLFLMGENTNFPNRNNSLSTLVNNAGGGTISVADQTNSPQTIMPPFNVGIEEIAFQGAGLSASGNGSFIAKTPNADTGAAILWDKEAMTNATGGTLIIVYDVNFMLSENNFIDHDQFVSNEQFLKNIFAKMSGKDPEAPETPGTSEYHTINIEVAPGIELYNLAAGNHQAEEGGHLQLQFLPEDRTATADNILFLVDGIETSFKDFGGSNYYSYILNPINGDHTILIAMKEYTVTLPEVEGVIFDVGSGDHAVGYGEKFTFTLTLAEGIDPAGVHVYANGTEVMPEALRATTLTYIIDKVTGPITVSIDGAGEPTGNADIARGDIQLRITNHELQIENTNSRAVDVAVYNITGKNVVSLRALRGSKTISLAAGIYIVKAGDEVRKVVIP